MLLEAAGTATAAAGGVVLRQAFRTTVTNTRTITTGGSFTGIANQGDIHGPANMTFGTPPRSAPNLAPAVASTPAQKRPIALIVLGSFLVLAGIGMICAGFYWE